MGFHVIDAIPRWVAAVDANALRSLLAAADEPYPDPFLHTRDGAGENTGSLQVKSWSPEIECAWDEVWEKEFAPEFQGVCRDSGFLRWRYLEHPRWHYALRAAVDGSGRPRAVAVSRIESLPGREESVFRILDLVFRDRESGAALASELMKTARAQGAAFADFYCTSAAAAAPLESLGFVRESSLERHLPALFQPLDFRRHDMNAAFWSHGRHDAHERYSDLALYVTRIEGDQDRPN
jgi:RimJ/RimL family protein N-acetyltransferase